MQKELVILVAGCDLEPWIHRTQECLDTWGKIFKDKGYNIKAVTPNPDLGVDYIVDSINDYLWVKADVSLETGGSTRLLQAFKWVLNQTNYDYALLVDNDAFVHPDRFLKALTEIKEEYKDNFNYWGCCWPYRIVTGKQKHHYLQEGRNHN